MLNSEQQCKVFLCKPNLFINCLTMTSVEFLLWKCEELIFGKWIISNLCKALFQLIRFVFLQVEFPPDLCSRVTFVNFTVTRSSLQSQCLNQVLKAERPDVDAKR